MADWDPSKYLEFNTERMRPALDLIARIPLRRPRLVYDLGCGPGNSTALLRAAYPSARIVGIDRSPAMTAQAKAEVAGVEFHSLDVAMWAPDKEADLVFANALFQWLPNHAQILQHILHDMKHDAYLAVQVPDNLAEPSHIAMNTVATQGQWASRLRRASESRAQIFTPTEYYNALRPHSSHIDVWRTVYNHAMENHEAIVEMLSSTGLKPYLDLLGQADRESYLSQYLLELKRSYPMASDRKVLFAFPRLFILAQRI